MSDPKKSKQQFDINDIDINKVIGFLSEHVNDVVKILLVIVTLAVTKSMFDSDHIQDQMLRSQASQVRQKLQVITARQKTVDDLDNFKKYLPNALNEDKMISQITIFATEHHVSIDSFSSVEHKDMGLYDDNRVSLTATAPNYKAAVLFLRAVEKSSSILMVNSWNGIVDEKTGAVAFTADIVGRAIHK